MMGSNDIGLHDLILLVSFKDLVALLLPLSFNYQVNVKSLNMALHKYANITTVLLSIIKSYPSAFLVSFGEATFCSVHVVQVTDY